MFFSAFLAQDRRYPHRWSAQLHWHSHRLNFRNGQLEIPVLAVLKIISLLCFSCLTVASKPPPSPPRLMPPSSEIGLKVKCLTWISQQAICIRTYSETCKMTMLRTYKMWSVYTVGLYIQVQWHGKYAPGDLRNVVFISRWSLCTDGL